MDTVRARRMIWEKELRGGDLEDQEGEDGGGNHRNTKRSSATVTMTMEGRVDAEERSPEQGDFDLGNSEQKKAMKKRNTELVRVWAADFLCAVATATDRGTRDFGVGSEGIRLRVCEQGEGWGGLGGLSGVTGVTTGKRHRGEGSENMHGECGTDFVLRWARRWDTMGWEDWFSRPYGSELLPWLTGTRKGYGNTQGGGSQPQGMVGADPSALQRVQGDWPLDRPHQGPILDRFTAFPVSVLAILRHATDQLSIRLRIPSKNSSGLPRGRLTVATEPPTPMQNGGWGGTSAIPDLTGCRR
ncbi:hypothetical protein VC83_06094 [Pseudogymnoascus destructans]|uniref:Uncharacterized protein n=1 Tax=Pseudogymnoascus destructans TaxID=655981 RepID=A0A177A9W9_9PEZI|nr:uncharacterized protein VC83_06094 [Pseudogymnoascus destructans]OAF58929.1 hypothetical protein VC83_06094 [Pseudogymnoascus destructans]